MGVYFTICSFIYICIFIIFFFSKTSIKTIETRVYKVMLVSTAIGLFLDAFSAMIYLYNADLITGLFYRFIVRLVFLYFLVWITSFSLYIYSISVNRQNKSEVQINNSFDKLFKKMIVVIIFLGIILFCLPLEFVLTKGSLYPSGLAVNFTYLIVSIFVIFDLFICIKNRKEIVNRKYSPLYALIVSFILTALIQKLFPDLFLVNFFLSIIVTIMYFTIENPDLKIIKELSYSKRMLEKANNATMKSLNSLSEDISMPLNKLFMYSSKNTSKQNIDEIINEAQNIKQLSVDLVNQITGIIELSKIESSKDEIKYYNYNFKDMLDELKQLLELKKINYKLTIDKKIPNVLLGDSEKIKQSIVYLSMLLSNTFINKTILLNISKLEVGSLCRLKFSFNVEEKNIITLIEEKNLNEKLLVNTKTLEFRILERLIELQRGKYVAKVHNNNVEYIVTIDQKQVKEYNIKTEAEKERKITPFNASGQRILIVDDSREKTKELIKKLQPYNTEIGVAHNYEEYNDLLYSDKTWDLILLDDMMPDSSKFEIMNLEYLKKDYVLEKIKRIAGYDISLVIMVTPSKNHLENKYKQMGLDYLLKPLSDYKLYKVLKKYLDNSNNE